MENIRMAEDIKRKMATYYGYNGDWDRLSSEWERKVRDGMTGLPTVYIDKAIEYASIQCAEMKTQLAEKQREVDALRAVIKDDKRIQENESKECAEMKEEIEALRWFKGLKEEESNRLQDENDSLKEENKRLKALNDSLEDRVDGLNNKYADAVAVAEKQHTAIKQLQEEVERLRCLTPFLKERIRRAFVAIETKTEDQEYPFDGRGELELTGMKRAYSDILQEFAALSGKESKTE